jgi:hypothetical protein
LRFTAPLTDPFAGRDRSARQRSAARETTRRDPIGGKRRAGTGADGDVADGLRRGAAPAVFIVAYTGSFTVALLFSALLGFLEILNNAFLLGRIEPIKVAA